MKKIINYTLNDLLVFQQFPVSLTSGGNLSAYLKKLLSGYNIDDSIFDTFLTYLWNVYDSMGYSLIPLTIEYNENDTELNIRKTYFPIIGRLIARLFTNDIHILKQYTNELQLNGLSYDKNSIMTDSKTGTVRKDIVRDETDDLKSMNENSPITSGALLNGEVNYTIDTPSARFLGNNTHTATNSDTDTFNTTQTDTGKESNPYYFEKYLQIMDKYNIEQIYTRIIEKIIYEFNEVY